MPLAVLGCGHPEQRSLIAYRTAPERHVSLGMPETSPPPTTITGTTYLRGETVWQRAELSHRSHWQPHIIGLRYTPEYLL